MNFENIKLTLNYKDNAHIALVELNRPKVLNALCTPLMVELLQAFNTCEKDKNVRVIILTGNERAFAAGADIGELSVATPVSQIQENKFQSWKEIQFISKPIIAAVNGFALGGGCELAMSCDFIVASDSAKFGQPEISIGTMPGAGGTQRLTHALGKSKAMYHILTGEMLNAKDAEKAGLVCKVVPEETLMTEVFEIAKTIAEKSPIAVKLAKEAVNASFEMSLRDGLEFERRNFYLTFASEDQKEGMNAFLEKRKPNYQGK